jgi:hypothetical protein
METNQGEIEARDRRKRDTTLNSDYFNRGCTGTVHSHLSILLVSVSVYYSAAPLAEQCFLGRGTLDLQIGVSPPSIFSNLSAI